MNSLKLGVADKEAQIEWIESIQWRSYEQDEILKLYCDLNLINISQR